MTSKIPCNFLIPNLSDYAIKIFSSAHLTSNECFLLNYYSITTRDEQLLSRNGFSNFSCLDLWMLSSQSSNPITSEHSISIRLYFTSFIVLLIFSNKILFLLWWILMLLLSPVFFNIIIILFLFFFLKTIQITSF